MKTITDYQTIVVHVPAGLWQDAYRLEWDYDNCCWLRFPEPERGKAISASRV